MRRVGVRAFVHPAARWTYGPDLWWPSVRVVQPDGSTAYTHTRPLVAFPRPLREATRLAVAEAHAVCSDGGRLLSAAEWLWALREQLAEVGWPLDALDITPEDIAATAWEPAGTAPTCAGPVLHLQLTDGRAAHLCRHHCTPWPRHPDLDADLRAVEAALIERMTTP